MFDDLNKSQLTYSNPSQTKASPSVYSDNDGSFNSEENLRWMTKKMAQKPFIVGRDTEDVDSNLSTSGAPYGLYIGEGLFSIDGYLFKVSPDSNVSYDNSFISGSAFVADTIYLQKFVGGLTNYGNQNELKTNLPEFCFPEFIPTPYGTTSVQTTRDNWKDALDNGSAVGFIRFVYSDDYKDQLQESSGYFEFIKNSAVIGRIKEESGLTSNSTPSEILSNIFSGDKSNCYSVCISETDANNVTAIYAYYPVYVKKSNTTTPKITFTDVFGFVYENEIEKFYTNTYPSTVYNLMDMNAGSSGSQDPLSNYSGFDRSTFPTKQYNYNLLYNWGGGSVTSRKTQNTEDISGPAYSTIPNVYKVSISDLQQYLSVDQQDITHIENNLSYYCIQFSSSDTTQITRNGQKIPVALFTSEGSLCTDGLIIDGNSTASQDSTTCVIESYIHYIKRNYLNATSQPVTEDAIESTTLSEMMSGWGVGFTTFYNEHIAKPLSSYINLCYYSLLDNVFYNTGSSDAEKIKARGAGYIVSGTPSGGGGVRTDVDIQATCYTVSGQTVTQTTKDTTISLEQDMTSDYYKVHTFVKNKYTDREKLMDDYDLYIYGTNTIDSTNTTYQPLLFEDPIEFMNNCVGYGVSGITSFTLTLPNNTDISIYESGKVVQLDEFLVPKRVKSSSITSFNLDSATTIMRTRNVSVSSMASSMCYEFYKNTWSVRIPTTISINKDALSYLRGRDYDNTNKYDGISWNYRFPYEVSDDELYVFDLKLSSDRTGESYDVEQSVKTACVDSEYLRVRREAFIHISKIYGDDYKGFEECVRDITDSIIESSMGGYDLEDFPKVRYALESMIDTKQKNLLWVYKNPNIYPKYPIDSLFKTDDSSNVSFKIESDNGVRIYVHIDAINGVRSATKDTTLSIPFAMFEDYVCLVGCPEGGSQSTYYAQLSDSSTTPDRILLTDTGDPDQLSSVIISGKWDYKYSIIIKQGTTQTEDFIFEPMVCNYNTYLVSNRNLPYTITDIDIKNSIESLGNDVSDAESSLKIAINRSEKNLLNMVDFPENSGPVTILISSLINNNDRYFNNSDDYVLSFSSILSDDSNDVTTFISLYNDQDVECYQAEIDLGFNSVTIIRSADVNPHGRPIKYIALNSTDTSCTKTLTFEEAMLCTLSEWELTEKYVRGIDVISVSKSVVDRPSKNLLRTDFYGTFHPTVDNPELLLYFERPIEADFYVLSCNMGAQYNDNIKFRFLKTDGTYTDYIEVANSTSGTVYFTKTSISNLTLLKIKGIAIRSNNMSDFTISDIMFCKKIDFDISSKYIESTSTIVDNSVDSIKNSIKTLIDSGSKNLLTLNSSSGTSYIQIPITLQPGVYYVYFGNITSDDTDVSSCLFRAFASDESDASDSVLLSRGIETYKKLTVFAETSYVRLYASNNFSHSTGDTVSYTNGMICTESDWNISNEYTPYCPTLYELYQMILNL